MKEYDLKGIACPGPVIKTREALNSIESGEIKIVVDNEASMNNVKRFSESQGYDVSVIEKQSAFEIVIKKTAAENRSLLKEKVYNIVAYINSDVIGTGSEELGKILMRAFLKTIPDISPMITTIILINKGVTLIAEGSDLLDTLESLECNGIEILACGTCLDYYRLMNQIKVGKVSNMFEILTKLANSDRVVTP